MDSFPGDWDISDSRGMCRIVPVRSVGSPSPQRQENERAVF